MQQPLQDIEQQRQEQIRRNQAIIDLLNAWDQEDPEEQRETLDYLIQNLDRDRPSSRKLFG
jgi:phage regulator Rha-like protein